MSLVALSLGIADVFRLLRCALGHVIEGDRPLAELCLLCERLLFLAASESRRMLKALVSLGAETSIRGVGGLSTGCRASRMYSASVRMSPFISIWFDGTKTGASGSREE